MTRFTTLVLFAACSFMTGCGAESGDATTVPVEAGPAVPCAGNQGLTQESCTLPDGGQGRLTCDDDAVVVACSQYCPTGCATGGSGTPLVLSFDRGPVAFTDAPGAFDLLADPTRGTRWVSAETPWIALDRNGNGRIDDGSELFGSMTELPGGGVAPNGFAALRALDTDGDGKITPHDARYAELLLWRDANQDRVSQPGELSRLADEAIVSIDLGYRVDRHCDDGDCEVEESTAVQEEGVGSHRRIGVIDVHLLVRGTRHQAP